MGGYERAMVQGHPEKDHEPHDAVTAQPGISTWRVFGIGTLLIVFNAFFGTYAYVVVQALIWTQTPLLRGPIVLLFFLALLNWPLLRYARRFALRQGELLLLYARSE